MPSETLDEAAAAPLRFERRAVDRWPLAGAATACRLGGERFGDTTALKMRDYSEEGLGAICRSPIEPGAIISVAFRAPGQPARQGVVLRCLPCGEGYHVAIRFERRWAA